jgi:hypothetical protein
MKKRVAKKIKDAFRAKLLERFPFFAAVDAKEIVSSGNMLFRSEASKPDYRFILLQFHHRKNMFTINVARSKDENFGTRDYNPLLGAGSRFIRVQKLWGQKTDFWLNFRESDDDAPNDATIENKETVMSEIDSMTDRCINLVKEYAIPFFEKDCL